MSPASSHALKHPPVTAPSEPAGAPSDFPELAVAIDRQRRRGRGAQSNASGRFEAEARVAFDDGWQSLEELPPFKTTVGIDTSRTTPAAAPGTSAASVATAGCSTPLVGMMTLSMDVCDASMRGNAALLSPCHTQISMPAAAFCGSRRSCGVLAKFALPVDESI